jgi:hypothetical protein
VILKNLITQTIKTVLELCTPHNPELKLGENERSLAHLRLVVVIKDKPEF